MTTVDTDYSREAMRGGVRPRRFGWWYVAEHRLRVLRTYGGTVVATAIGTPFLYLFAFGVGLGALVSANLGPEAVDGVSYLTFVAPALICSAALVVASEELTYPIMLGFKWNPTFIGMNAAPLTGRQIIDGIVVFVAIRMTATSVLYWAVMMLFGAIPSGWALLVIPISVLTGLAFGLPLLAYSASIKEDRGQFAVVMRVVLLPITLFSGTIFPLEQLPQYLWWIGWISPLWHGSELARVAAYGADNPVWIHVAYLVALCLVGWLLSRRIATKRLDK